jgi:hypothetical protein
MPRGLLFSFATLCLSRLPRNNAEQAPARLVKVGIDLAIFTEKLPTDGILPYVFFRFRRTADLIEEKRRAMLGSQAA